MAFMKDKWTKIIVTGLIGLSILFYGLDFIIFKQIREEFLWFWRTLSFMPIEVLLVTLVIQKMIDERDKQSKLKKLNMVIGLFFSEAGRELLIYSIKTDPLAEEKRKCLKMGASWTDKDFISAIKETETETKNFEKKGMKLIVDRAYMKELKEVLSVRREFMVKLLENSSLLEHESFSELLTYIFHLIEELDMRKDLLSIPNKDLDHLEIDLRRAYLKLVMEWLRYMKHLKKEYPYLYSFAIRTNPFEKEAKVEIND